MTRSEHDCTTTCAAIHLRRNVGKRLDHVVAGGGRPVDRIASVHFGPARNAAGYESGWFRKMEVFYIATVYRTYIELYSYLEFLDIHK